MLDIGKFSRFYVTILVLCGSFAAHGACATCHGATPQGQMIGDITVPPIAGRSAIDIVWQLYDIQQGARAGAWSALMQPVVAHIELDDMIAIAAYVASRPVAASKS